jgi:hypothetical protein
VQLRSFRGAEGVKSSGDEISPKDKLFWEFNHVQRTRGRRSALKRAPRLGICVKRVAAGAAKDCLITKEDLDNEESFGNVDFLVI